MSTIFFLSVYAKYVYFETGCSLKENFFIEKLNALEEDSCASPCCFRLVYSVLVVNFLNVVRLRSDSFVHLISHTHTFSQACFFTKEFVLDLLSPTRSQCGEVDLFT